MGELLLGKELDRRAIAKLLGVNVAAADKHIEALVEHLAGIDDRRQRNRRTIRLNLASVSAPASRSMAVAACFGASLADLFRGSAYELLLRQALEHVLGQVRKQADFKDARRKFVFASQGGEFALPDQQGTLDELVEAVLRQERVSLKYQGFDGEERLVEVTPWSIVIYEHQLYLIAEGTGSTPDVYRFSRIRDATRRTTKRFDYPSRAIYEPEVVFRDAFGIWVRGTKPVVDVTLRLDERWRSYAETHRWHGSQRLDRSPGELIVRMRLRTCPELEAFILGFGEEAEVLEPPELRERVAKRAADLAAVYSKTKPAKAKSTAKGQRGRRGARPRSRRGVAA